MEKKNNYLIAYQVGDKPKLKNLQLISDLPRYQGGDVNMTQLKSQISVIEGGKEIVIACILNLNSI